MVLACDEFFFFIRQLLHQSSASKLGTRDFGKKNVTRAREKYSFFVVPGSLSSKLPILKGLSSHY